MGGLRGEGALKQVFEYLKIVNSTKEREKVDFK
jgi:hypothetical protein